MADRLAMIASSKQMKEHCDKKLSNGIYPDIIKSLQIA